MDTQITNVLNTYLPFITLALSIIALVLIAVLFNKVADLLKRVRTISHSQRLSADTSPPKSESTFDYSRVIVLEKSIQELNEKINALEVKPEPLSVTEAIAEPIQDNEPVVEEDVKCFSKFPDQDQGFAESSLMWRQNGEQIYELTLVLEQGRGTFVISESSEVQRYALSDVKYYLPKGCEFINQPGNSTIIKTVHAGTLEKSGDIWSIVKKAQIEFI